ncbi:Rab2a [Hexamita inflata]|uniref:Rab2a n=1 Tax=Hexamita inflata TaxID=28002 RepID=A0ABP1I766_9EUKA
MFDTAGMEQYQAMSTQHVRQADYCLVCYAVDDERSIASVKTWVEFVQKNNATCKMVLVGNKADVEGKDESALEELKMKFTKVVKCSAKTDENIAEVLKIDWATVTEHVKELVQQPKGGCC